MTIGLLLLSYSAITLSILSTNQGLPCQVGPDAAVDLQTAEENTMRLTMIFSWEFACECNISINTPVNQLYHTGTWLMLQRELQSTWIIDGEFFCTASTFSQLI
jgi:hypothetical protein